MKPKPEVEVDVEQLSERRWAEVRRAVLMRARELPPPASMPPPARARLRRWQAATAVAVAVAASVLLAWVATGRAPDADSPATDSPAAGLVATSRVVTDDAGATVSAGDVTVEVAAFSSVMMLERAEHEWLVSIEHGSARFLVPPRGGLPPFRVEAGETRVAVIGTRFSVSRTAGAHSGEVVVEQGAVQVIEDGEQVVLHDGERWPRLTSAAERDPRGPASPSREVAPSVGLHPEDRALPEAPEERRRTPSSRGATSSEVEVEAGASPVSPEATAPSVDTASPAPAVDEASAPPPVADARARYEEAAGIESTDPARALALYEALAREGGSWGATALFAQARLEMEQHHEARARPLLERYLVESPRGVNAADARRLLEQLR